MVPFTWETTGSLGLLLSPPEAFVIASAHYGRIGVCEQYIRCAIQRAWSTNFLVGVFFSHIARAFVLPLFVQSQGQARNTVSPSVLLRNLQNIGIWWTVWWRNDCFCNLRIWKARLTSPKLRLSSFLCDPQADLWPFYVFYCNRFVLHYRENKLLPVKPIILIGSRWKRKEKVNKPSRISLNKVLQS